MLTSFLTAAAEFLSQGEPKQRAWVERRARFILGVRENQNEGGNQNDTPPRKRARYDVCTPVSSPVKGKNDRSTDLLHNNASHSGVDRTSTKSGGERTTRKEHEREVHVEIHPSPVVTNISFTELLNSDGNDYNKQDTMHNDLAGETRVCGGDESRGEMRRVRIQDGRVHLASELNQTMQQQERLGSDRGSILPEETIRERNARMSGRPETTDSDRLHTLLSSPRSPVDVIKLYCEETPYQSPIEIDFQAVRNKKIAYDQYDWLYEKCFKEFREWWSEHGDKINQAYEIMDNHKNKFSQITIDSFKFARDYCLNHLYESESARKSLQNLKLSGETENCALDLQLNVAKLWADKEGGGGMRWCMLKCTEHAKLILNGPLADDRQEKTTNVDRA